MKVGEGKVAIFAFPRAAFGRPSVLQELMDRGHFLARKSGSCSPAKMPMMLPCAYMFRSSRVTPVASNVRNPGKE
jgi:hypothetical protein